VLNKADSANPPLCIGSIASPITLKVCPFHLKLSWKTNFGSFTTVGFIVFVTLEFVLLELIFYRWMKLY